MLAIGVGWGSGGTHIKESDHAASSSSKRYDDN
jgi:hypothetical protein